MVADEVHAIASGDNDRGVYRTRRRTLVLLLVASLVISHRWLPSSYELVVFEMNRVSGMFPDQAFEQLVRSGKAMPAPPGEVQHWIESAALNGNADPKETAIYVVASTYVIEEGTQLPNGMYGVHSKMFLLRKSRELPRNAQASDNTFLMGDGTCVGPLIGCASL